MSTPFHNQVTLRGFHFEDSIFTVNLAAGITKADEGKALALDPSAPNTMKLAGDGDTIVGRLEVVEDRAVEGKLVGACAFRFANVLPIASGATVNVGDTVIGAGNGEVKRLENAGVPAPDHSVNFVVEIIGTDAVVVKI